MQLQELCVHCLLPQFTQIQKGKRFLSCRVLCNLGKQLKHPEFKPQPWTFTS